MVPIGQKIAMNFNGRTENSIKNRFYSTLRRITREKRKEKNKNDYETISSSKNLNELINYLPCALNELTKKFFKFKNIKPEDYGKFNLNLNMKKKIIHFNLLILNIKTV